MNDRERFQAIMHYRPVDRCMIQDFQYWNETVDVWKAYGLPPGSVHDGIFCEEFFGFDPFWKMIHGAVTLCPAFEHKVLEETERFRVVQQGDGTTVRYIKVGASIPEELDHTLKDRASWEQHFKWRLDPARPERLPADLDQRLAAAADAQRTWPLGTGAGSMFGELRNWMGILGVSYIQADDPALFDEMIATIGDCIVGSMRRVLDRARAAGVTFDYGAMWEDMSFAQGPLLGVPAFERLLVPQYKRITGPLREYGTDITLLDSDGDARLLYPGWLRGGVNCAFPMEVGTWGNEPVSCRKTFGPEMRIMGGFSKRILAAGPDAIAREVDRLAPLAEAGGFIPFCDHRVPPDVSLENYIYYVQRARAVWGKGLPNLRPMGAVNTKAPLYGQPYDFRKVIGDAPPSH